MEKEYNNPGALPDSRTEEEKLKDYRFEEVVASAAPVKWIEKKQKDWRKFPIFDQDGSGSCVAQTMKKLLGVYIWLKTKVWVNLSATHIYQRRANRPAGGMGSDDVFKIAQKGTTLEAFAASENMNDAQMDAIQILPFMEKIGEVFKIGKFMTAIPGNIDTIASIIQETGKAVMVWFYFSDGLKPKEWDNVPRIQHVSLPITGSNTARHSVAAVDFTLYGGQKALIIDDSWGLDKAMEGQRVITEDFFKNRNFFVGHFMNFAFEDQTQPSPDPAPRPHYNFTRDLEFSPVLDYGDVDVIALQNILKFEGCFPSNIESTGYFGAITKESVGKFQLKHGIINSEKDAGFGRVGPKTRAKLNSLYN